MATWEDLMRQKGQQLTQAGQNVINQNIDIPAQQRIAALQQVGSGPAVGGPSGPGAMIPPPAPPQQDLAAPNAPTMSASDAQSRMNAMIQAPLTMDQVQAKLKQQADQDAASEAHANALQDEMYSQPNAAPTRFAGLKQQVASPATKARVDIKDETSPKQALSEDQEAQINKQLSGDDDDEDEKASAGVKQTGILGGV